MVTKYSAFTPEPQADQSAESTDTSSSRVYTGAIRHTFGSEVVSQANHTFHQTAVTGQAGGSIMDTLQRDRSGYSVETIPGVSGSRTLITAAVRDGLVRPRVGGGWEDVTSPTGEQRTLAAVEAEQQAATAAVQQEDGNKAAEAAEFIDAEDEKLWAEDVAPLRQDAHDSALASAIGVVALGVGSFEDTARSLAKSQGIDPALALDYVEQGAAMHERTVARILAKEGISDARKEEAYEHFRSQPAKLQDALQKLVYSNDATAFRAMATSFKASNPGDTSMYTKAGFEVHTDRQSGEVLIKREGGNWVKASELGKATTASVATRAQAPAAPVRERMVICPASGNLIPESWL